MAPGLKRVGVLQERREGNTDGRCVDWCVNTGSVR